MGAAENLTKYDEGEGDKWDSDVIFGPTILDMLNVALHSLMASNIC